MYEKTAFLVACPIFSFLCVHQRKRDKELEEWSYTAAMNKWSCVVILSAFLLVVVSSAQFDCPTIISRSEWGARSTSLTSMSCIPPGKVFIHHTAGSSCSSLSSCKSQVKSIQNYHIDGNGWTDIGYNFLIGGDGRVYEGRGWGKQGAHTPSFNDKSIGIAFIGTFTSSAPSSSVLAVGKDLIVCGLSLGHIAVDYQLYGHKQAKSTSCPGDALYSQIQTWQNWSPAFVYSGASCISAGGQCQHNTGACSGNYASGLCPGPAGVQCCKP